ncbi:PatA/PatG family cyanobactin maturation protease [Undibacterium sp. Rencai35W]|uniref:PatA/PatG family cyanobactin maturation protease n=1 Tax=Undibacterium sp. Rencai35W TaxID=3413046 RepID=UPI003BF1E069
MTLGQSLPNLSNEFLWSHVVNKNNPHLSPLPNTSNHGLLHGFDVIWQMTKGTSDICVAVLDGSVDLTHPCFAGANLEVIETMASDSSHTTLASEHGTHTASIIFGQPDSPVVGFAPHCRGLIVPIFSDAPNGGLVPCSQIDLARAITQAVEHGAHIINVSGGQLSDTGEADALLLNAINLCKEKNVLLVAAAGNDGCECLHIPASISPTLVVGALDQRGKPMSVSNWAKGYQHRGIMAVGANILGALPGGRTGLKSGTSFATPIVSSVAALLLSRQPQHGDRPDPRGVCAALLQSAIRCNTNGDIDCRRLLTGTLHVLGALQLILRRKIIMSEENLVEASDTLSSVAASEYHNPINIVATEVMSSAAVAFNPGQASLTPIQSVMPSDCGCGGTTATTKSGPALVYALGTIGIDFGTEARRDSFAQAMPANANNPNDPNQLLDFLAKNPYYKQSLIWTLSLDATPIYAIVPTGPYALDAYEKLFDALTGTIGPLKNILMNSFPGVVLGSVKLMSGQVVPLIEPAVRGIFSWNIDELCQMVFGASPAAGDVAFTKYQVDVTRMTDYLNRIYYSYRNLGISGADRALNYAATNAIQAALVFEKTGDMELDAITVEKSPICRPGSECYDIVMRFFTPANMNVARVAMRFGVDVSDVIPVTVGTIRHWSER